MFYESENKFLGTLKNIGDVQFKFIRDQSGRVEKVITKIGFAILQFEKIARYNRIRFALFAVSCQDIIGHYHKTIKPEKVWVGVRHPQKQNFYAASANLQKLKIRIPENSGLETLDQGKHALALNQIDSGEPCRL